MFLPWASIGFLGSVNGLQGIGFLVLFAFIGAGIVAFLGDQTKSLDKTMWFVALACGAIAALIVVINVLRMISYITPSIGAWLAVAASIGILYSAWVFKSPGDDIKSGFDSLKKNINDRTNQPPNQPQS